MATVTCFAWFETAESFFITAMFREIAPTKNLMETQLVCIHFKGLHMTSSLAVLDVQFLYVPVLTP